MNWHHIIRVITGVFVVPLSIITLRLWPWWSKAPLSIKILTGIIVLPLTGFSLLTAKWWNEY